MTSSPGSNSPIGMTKAAIFRLLNNFNEKTVRRDVNSVIAKSRNIPPDEAKYQRVLKPSEVEKVLAMYQ